MQLYKIISNELTLYISFRNTVTITLWAAIKYVVDFKGTYEIFQTDCYSTTYTLRLVFKNTINTNILYINKNSVTLNIGLIRYIIFKYIF